MSDTDPRITPPETPAAKNRSRTAPVTLGLDPVTKQKINGVVVGLAVALMTALWSRVDACEAKDTAAAAIEKGERGEEKAEAAKLVTDGAARATKDKIDPQGEDIRQLREDLNVLLAERQERIKRIEARGKRPKSVPPKSVSPETIQPLQVPPAAAAAAEGAK
jgi:hypothetical protein